MRRCGLRGDVRRCGGPLHGSFDLPPEERASLVWNGKPRAQGQEVTDRTIIDTAGEFLKYPCFARRSRRTSEVAGRAGPFATRIHYDEAPRCSDVTSAGMKADHFEPGEGWGASGGSAVSGTSSRNTRWPPRCKRLAIFCASSLLLKGPTRTR
jgi:hypothetical protein